MGFRGQAPVVGPGGGAPQKLWDLAIFKDENQHSEVPFRFLKIFDYSSIFFCVNDFLGSSSSAPMLLWILKPRFFFFFNINSDEKVTL